MELNDRQKDGLKLAITRYNNGEKYTVISGFAGTGKTTLVKHIIQELGIDENFVCHAAFTGKAAEVLRNKGNKNCITLHKLLFDSFPLPRGGFKRVPKVKLDYKIVVVDEISMAPAELVNRLLSYNVYVLFLGDPFQLPPIDKNSDNHLLDSPHIFLDEIMRQEAESEIIQLTMAIREGKQINTFDGKDVKIFEQQDLSTGMMEWADQIICATNRMRFGLNKQMREIKGFEGIYPVEGDKLICLRNYWETGSEINDDPIVNGTIGYLEGGYDTTIQYPRFIVREPVPVLCGNLRIPELNDTYKDLIFDKKMIGEGVKTLESSTEYQIHKNRTAPPTPMEFAYGYAITCHKAQGSSYNKVLVVEESFPFDTIEHARWLYTACTRAVDKLVLVLR